MKFSLGTAKDITDLVKQLAVGLTKLTFEENIECFKVEDLVIKAGKIAIIENKLTFPPKQYIITSQEGIGQVTKFKKTTSSEPDYIWNNEYVYLKNNGSATVTITVLFMR